MHLIYYSKSEYFCNCIYCIIIYFIFTNKNTFLFIHQCIDRKDYHYCTSTYEHYYTSLVTTVINASNIGL